MSKCSSASLQRRLPIGAEVLGDGEVHFRVWASHSQRVEVIIGGGSCAEAVIELTAETSGYFSASSPLAKPGDLYSYRLNRSELLVPDPASRFQPEGPLGPSMIIDPARFLWHDTDWGGVKIEGQVIYEMHIGTFTAEGTWKAASQQLKALKDLGVTVLEIMPVHDFCGRFGWGYDGVDFFAPTRLYGSPDDFRAFIDDAHGLGLGIILDVVYNHAGPAGNYLKDFSPDYFTDRYSTDWGEALNFDGPNSGPVREFFISNAGYWIDEFHLDGLRLDATQNMYDASKVHMLAEITNRVRQGAAGRSTIIVAENEPQDVRLIQSLESGGYGLDALWNDDFHHSAMVALTGHNEAYYSDHRGTPQEFISAVKRGFLYQGQYYSWQQQRRGSWTGGLKPAAFIHFLQNHDQIANFGLGQRIHQLSHPGAYRAMTALFLLSPQTPMLFQGQEFAASSPLVFFADHNSELGSKVKEGRFDFLKQFPSLANPDMQKRLADPTNPRSFESCRLDLSERERHHETYALHRDLLTLRRNDPVIKAQRPGAVDGAVLADDAFVLRFFGEHGNDRLLLVNLGIDCSFTPAPEPLLASPAGLTWRLSWSSEDPRYGGHGAAPTEDESRWFIPGKAAFLLTAPKIMNPIIRKVSFSPGKADESEFDREPEWLVANGLGGYASGTVSGAATRRYHGLLIAALAAPFGRVLMLNGLAEEFHLPDGRVVEISAGQSQERNAPDAAPLSEFRLDMGLPIWRYEIDDFVLEKRLYLPYRQNTVHITYRLLSHAGKLEIRLRPLIQFREHEGPVDSQAQAPYMLTVVEDQYEISSGIFPTLRLLLYSKGEFIIERKKIERLSYILEQTRGYTAVGDLWTPGSFAVDCSPGQEITLAASTESWEVMRALGPAEAWEAERERRTRLIASADPKAQTGVGAELVLAADQFVVTPAGRLPDATRAYATGDEMRTVIAGYHWFTDWGRDTMISLEGLTLTTNRFLEAGWILRNFANAIRQGLIPNLFPEGSREGLYHTADATLWFFHAIDRYLQATGDRWTLRLLLPKLIDIIDCHIKGTLFGIGVDSKDGLLSQGQENYQLTWMDAKVDDWVVTPRRGKAVEINALWYNALRLLQQWLSEEDQADKALELEVHADRARASFNERFWYGDEGYLFDVIDGENGNDAACRPNQLLAISLRHPVLDPAKWRPMLETVRRRLLTPVGLRSLAPGHPNYKARYFGDLRSRDAAYHQGTVWAWLIGPFIDAWLKVHPEDVAGAHALLEGFVPHLGEAGVGSISEIFDADEPFVPRGCISQAWSVAEVLRCWVKTAS